MPPPMTTTAMSARTHVLSQREVANANAKSTRPATAPTILNASATRSRFARCVAAPELMAAGPLAAPIQKESVMDTTTVDVGLAKHRFELAAAHARS